MRRSGHTCETAELVNVALIADMWARPADLLNGEGDEGSLSRSRSL